MGCIAHVGGNRGAYKALFRGKNLKNRGHLEELSIDARLMLKYIEVIGWGS